MSGVENRVEASQLFESLDQSRLTSRHASILGLSYSANFLDNYDTVALGVVLPILAGLLKLSPAQVGFLASSVFIGMFFGSYLVSRLSDMIGRKNSLILSIAIFSLGAISVIFSWDYNSLLAFRILQGLGIGAEIPVVTTFVAEFAPLKRRAILTAMVSAVFAAGGAGAGPISNLVVGVLGWRGVFIVGAAMGFIIILLMLLFLPESVRQLVKLGKLDAAERVVRRVSSVDPSQVQSKPETTSALAALGKGKFRDLISGRYRTRSFGLWVAAIIHGMIFSVFLTMLTTVFVRGGIPYTLSVIFNSFILFAGVIGNVLAGVSIEWFGRRRTIYVAYSLIGTFTLLSGVGLFLNEMDMVVILGLFTSLCISIAFGSLVVYVAELYPTNVRNTGQGTMQALVRFGSIIGPTALGILLATPAYFFFMEGSLLLVNAVIMFLIVYETRGKSLERITQELSSPLIH